MQNNNLTVRQAAAILGVSPRRVQALIKSKLLPAQRFGHVYMIGDDDLRNYVPKNSGRPKTNQ